MTIDLAEINASSVPYPPRTDIANHAPCIGDTAGDLRSKELKIETNNKLIEELAVSKKKTA